VASLQLLPFVDGAAAVKCLVYGIFLEKDVPQVCLPATLDGCRLTIVVEGTIAAACSLVPAAVTAPDVPELLGYARVVNALFERATFLPMRFGCWLDGEQELRQLLDRNGGTFRAQLEHVDGCVELGIRALPTEAGRPGRSVSPTVVQNAAPDAELANEDCARVATLPQRPGAAYLLARMGRYQKEDLRKEAFECMGQSVRDALAGLYVQSIAERHVVAHDRFWLWYFLVRRENVERFREAFGLLQKVLPQPLLLSGPWPPYNFVAKDA